ncbi:hypothetical protein PROFUN_03243, partial [Planoprotostelium fungivorum]
MGCGASTGNVSHDDINTIKKYSGRDVPDKDIKYWKTVWDGITPTGRLTINEFVRFVRQSNIPIVLIESLGKEQDARNMFRMMDKDGNGLMEFAEFVLVLILPKSAEQFAHLCISVYDEDGDGAITHEELLRFSLAKSKADGKGGPNQRKTVEESSPAVHSLRVSIHKSEKVDKTFVKRARVSTLFHKRRTGLLGSILILHEETTKESTVVVHRKHPSNAQHINNLNVSERTAKKQTTLMSSNPSEQQGVPSYEGQQNLVSSSAPPGWEGGRGGEITGSIAPALTAGSSAPLGSKPWENLPQGLSNMSLRAAQSQSRGALTRSFPSVATFNPNGQGGFPPNSSFGNAPYNPTGPYADIRGDAPRYGLNSGSLNSSPAIHVPRSGLSQSHTGLLPPGAIGSPLATGHPLTSSSGGLRSSNTGIMTGTSLRASGVHPIPVPVDATVPLELGVICLLKDNYGFVRCVDREEDIFFHCTSLIPPQPLNSEELHAFITSIRVGNEVSFHVVNDTRTNKLSAVNLSLLPKGSVVFTETIQEKVRGIILREISEHSDENDFGVVAYRTTEDTVEQLRFGPMDLDEPRVPLAPEDEVEFDIVYNRRLKGKCAAHVVLMRFGGDRQTGVIHSVKDGFGFIRCCDSPRSLYFHFRDVVLLQRGQEISKGVEVEYTVANDERAGKLCAVRVRGLPKGTVSFTVQHEERVRGTVQRELSPNFPTPLGASPFTRREDEDKGVITFNTPEGTDSLLFGLQDIRNHTNMGRVFPFLRYGDEIECTVLIDKRNGRKHASDITLVTAVTEKVEMGVVCSVKKNYGHITCAEQDEDLFFHFTDFEDNNLLESLTTGEKDIHPGMEVQFIIVPDSRTGKKKAAHIHLLNAGTVKFEDVSDSRLQGIVIRECKPGQTGYTGKRQPSDLGMI